MSIYGYARISRKQQSIERQIRNIKAEYPNAVILQEAYTGTKIDRPEWNKLYKKLKKNDIVVFDSVSRMSRNADDGFKLYEELYNKGVELVFLKEPHINTATYKQSISNRIQITVDSGSKATDKMINSMMSVLNEYALDLAKEQIILAFAQAEKEVEDLHQRTKEGIETARLNGKQIGQKEGAKLTTKKSVEAKKLIEKHSKDFNGTLNDVECMQMLRLSRNTYYKYKKELKETV
jgi:DNA invertase Pin-like site-specific DNA recombinase